MPVRHHLFATALGPCGIAWSERGIVALQLPEKNEAATEHRLKAKAKSSGTSALPAEINPAVENVIRYLDRTPVDFATVHVDLDGIDPLRRKLYDALRNIGFGNTITYGALAARIGLDGPEAARDVGAAMGMNPIPIIIPCHRVLAAGGKLGGFSAYGGPTTKQKLLALEGVHLDRGAPRLPGF